MVGNDQPGKGQATPIHDSQVLANPPPPNFNHSTSQLIQSSSHHFQSSFISQAQTVLDEMTKTEEETPKLPPIVPGYKASPFTFSGCHFIRARAMLVMPGVGLLRLLLSGSPPNVEQNVERLAGH